MYHERKLLLEKIEDELKAKNLLYVTSDRRNGETQIAGDVFDHFVNHLDKIGVVDRICFIRRSKNNTLRR